MLKWQIALLEDAKIVYVRFQLFDNHVIIIYLFDASPGNVDKLYPNVEPVNIETTNVTTQIIGNLELDPWPQVKC